MNDVDIKFFDRINNRLVCIKDEATAEFWDKHWDSVTNKKSFSDLVLSHSRHKKITEKYLKNGNKVLEGGCGRGQLVYCLDKWGFLAYGIDYAKEMIEKLKVFFPDLNFTCGDVRKLPYQDGFFDAYWSLGVIEHFYEGFESIAKEMKRVLKSGGYLFVTFPHLSKLRIWKVKMNKYSVFAEQNVAPDNFYQFILDHNFVRKQFEAKGFVFQESKLLDGVKGFKDEIEFGRSILQKIYNSNNFFIKFFRRVLSLFLSCFSSHSVLLVFKRS